MTRHSRALASGEERLGTPRPRGQHAQRQQGDGQRPGRRPQQARNFYSDTLGLSPADENPGGLIYRTAGGTTFFLYETEYAGQAGHTIAQFHVADVEQEVKELRDRGVQFEHYDMPGMTWDGDVASAPEMGKAAWFKDSEGNILCLDDASM